MNLRELGDLLKTANKIVFNETGKVILVTNNKKMYCFENLYCTYERKKRIDVQIKVNLKMMDDSYLIKGVDI